MEIGYDDARARRLPALPNHAGRRNESRVTCSANRMNNSTRNLFATLLCLASLVKCPAQEWTRFRGPNGSGISTAKTIPAKWEEKDFNWKTELPGAGHSSPVLWGDKIFVTSGDDRAKEVYLICAGATDGKILWQQAFPFAPYSKNGRNTFASGTAAVDQDRVYFCWSDPDHYMLAALAHDGKKAWEQDLGPYASQHGGGNSPIVWKDQVVLAKEQDGESFLVAVEAATGKTRWRTARRTAEAGYATPLVYEPEGAKPALICVSHGDGISAIAPESGAVLWELGNLFDKRVVSSPIVAAGLIIGACGSGGGGNYVVAVRPGDGAKGTKPALAYKISHSAPYVPTSVCVGDRLFLWSDGGIVSLVQASSGELKWQERVGGDYFSSPVWVDGRLFGISTRGEVVVLEASDEFKVLARNSLGEETESTPAVARGRMYIHTVRHLVSVGR